MSASTRVCAACGERFDGVSPCAKASGACEGPLLDTSPVDTVPASALLRALIEADLREMYPNTLDYEGAAEALAKRVVGAIQQRPFEFLYGLGYRAENASVTVKVPEAHTLSLTKGEIAALRFTLECANVPYASLNDMPADQLASFKSLAAKIASLL